MLLAYRLIGVVGLISVLVSIPRLRLMPRRVFWVSSLLVVATLRVSHLLMVARGVPDVGRSVIVGGFQIHHIVFGVIVCVGAWLVFGQSVTQARGLMAAAVYALAIGLVVDEAFYVLLTGVTDADYMSAVSVAGIPLLYAGIAVLLQGERVGVRVAE